MQTMDHVIMFYCYTIASSLIISAKSNDNNETIRSANVHTNKLEKGQAEFVTVKVRMVLASNELYEITLNNSWHLDNLTNTISLNRVSNGVHMFISGLKIEPMILLLKRSHVTIADDLIVRHDDASTSLKEISQLDFNKCQFTGRVQEQKHSFTTINFCNGVNGEIDIINNTATLKTVRYGNTIRHVLHMKPSLANGGAKCSQNASNTNQSRRKKRLKRQVNVIQISSPKYIELNLVFDHSMYLKLNASLENCMRRAINIIADANSYFSQFYVYITLASMEVWSTRNRILYPREGRSSATFDADTIMTHFNAYRYQNNWTHASDAAVLITNEKLSVPSRSKINGICSLLKGGISVTDYHDSTRYTAILLSHGLGHLLGLNHVNAEEGCECSPTTSCIMSNNMEPNPPQKKWSECSKSQLRMNLEEHHIASCLNNKPFAENKEAICGDSVVDKGEDCDCGPADRCTSRCCNPQTCKLYANATCAAGACCEMDTCIIKRKGAICRSSNDETCDVEERCDGTSEWCPADNHQPNGIKCVNNGDAYCYGGRCRSHTSQCQYIYGERSVSANDACYYTMNWRESIDGNCGLTGSGGFRSCPRRFDARCGLLHCETKFEGLAIPIQKVRILSNTTSYIFDNQCSQVAYDSGDPRGDLGQVPNGAKCGRNGMCVNSTCVSVDPNLDVDTDGIASTCTPELVTQDLTTTIVTLLVIVVIIVLLILVILFIRKKLKLKEKQVEVDTQRRNSALKRSLLVQKYKQQIRSNSRQSDQSWKMTDIYN